MCFSKVLVRNIDTVAAKKTKDVTIFASNGSRYGVCCVLETIVVAHLPQLLAISFVMTDAFRATLHLLRSLEYADDGDEVSRENDSIV